MRHTKHIQTICSHDNKVLTEKTDVAEAKYLFKMQELSPHRKLMLISQISWTTQFSIITCMIFITYRTHKTKNKLVGTNFFSSLEVCL